MTVLLSLTNRQLNVILSIQTNYPKNDSKGEKKILRKMSWSVANPGCANPEGVRQPIICPSFCRKLYENEIGSREVARDAPLWDPPTLVNL